MLIQTTLLLISVQVCVSFLSLPLLIKIFKLNKYPHTPVNDLPHSAEKNIDQVYWAISTARRVVPFMSYAKCLAQALTAKHLLKKKKIACVLFIGAKIVGKKKLEAHAWLQCAQITMNFGADDNDFTELVRFY